MTAYEACEHRPSGSKYQVVPTATRSETPMHCPCCGLGAVREVGDIEPMFCPYCDQRAVDGTSVRVDAGESRG